MKVTGLIAALLASVLTVQAQAQAKAPAKAKKLPVDTIRQGLATFDDRSIVRAAPPVLIKNATVMTVTKGTLTNTDLLLRGGKIAQIGKNLVAPA